MPLPSLPFLVLDTETTGFKPRVHRIIEFACIRFENGKKVKEVEQLLSVKDEVPPHVQILTGIRPEDLEGKPAFTDIAPFIRKQLTPETIIVGQNIGFDLSMLKGEGLDLTAQPWIDTSMLASIVFPELKSYSLGYLATVLKLEHEPQHRALGDVRATVALLAKCCERLSELPETLLKSMRELSSYGPAGYRQFFASIAPTKKGAAKPAWLTRETAKREALPKGLKGALGKKSDPSALTLWEESFDPIFLEYILNELSELPGTHLVAVKNLEATLRRVHLPEHATVLYPPELLIHEGSDHALLAQEAFTADELTLAIKLKLYEPTVRSLLPIHGEEYAVWSGKIASTRDGETYRRQLKDVKGLVLLDHHELLNILEQGDTPPFDASCHITIDDASMLEDTATAAWSWDCPVRSLRASSEGHAALTKVVDLLELWLERTRAGKDRVYLVRSDVDTPETAGLLSQVGSLLSATLSAQAKTLLTDLGRILTKENLAGRITWIECSIEGNLLIKSVPEDVALALKVKLYGAYETSLIVPPKSEHALQAIVLPTIKTERFPSPESACSLPSLCLPTQWDMRAFLTGAVGKNVLLLGSKRSIEDLYVKYFEELSRLGITLLCQGMSGGQSRMQAEFSAARSPAVLVVTPWTYETFELPEGTVDHVLLATLPFDHPEHVIGSKRAARYADGFSSYTLPRAKNRLFRLIRTFCRHKSDLAVLTIADERLRTRKYGVDIERYLRFLLPTEAAKEQIGKKPAQMPLL